ncbi:MAG: nuclear transport factor 2 family protein [Ignavibacteriae bacterium]|nr:nuclear transport factor 2 family protein [Ignavibacteriota bacterium]MCB9214510.1 nuclear transport factor 2 family protein [Ignavibacteria bacterium]
MKQRIFAVILAIAILPLQLQAEEETEMNDIKDVIEQFKKSGDQQNPELAEKSLHEESRIFYIGKDGVVVTRKEGYLRALESKVIGGTEREMSVERIEITGAVATAHVQFSSNEALFDQFVNLVKSESGWQIVNIVLNFQPKG